MKNLKEYINEGHNDYIDYVEKFLNDNKDVLGIKGEDTIEIDGSGKMYLLHKDNTTTSLKSFPDTRSAKNYFSGVIDAINVVKKHDIKSFGWVSL